MHRASGADSRGPLEWAPNRRHARRHWAARAARTADPACSGRRPCQRRASRQRRPYPPLAATRRAGGALVYHPLAGARAGGRGNARPRGRSSVRQVPGVDWAARRANARALTDARDQHGDRAATAGECPRSLAAVASRRPMGLRTFRGNRSPLAPHSRRAGRSRRRAAPDRVKSTLSVGEG